MSTPLTFQTICKAKDPATCRNHGQVASLRKLMDEAEADQNFDAYFQARKDFESTTELILLDEMQDYAQYEELFATELEDAETRKNLISQQLMSMNDKANYEGMNWKQFAKWAVQVRTPQSYGAMLEKRYIHELGLTKIESAEGRGDFKHPRTGKYTEFKVSVAKPLTKHAVHFVQIRPHHEVDNYHMVIVNRDTGKSELFVIPKEKMTEELASHGRLAHGRNVDEAHDKNEFAIRFSALKTDEVYKHWKASFAKPFPIK